MGRDQDPTNQPNERRLDEDRQHYRELMEREGGPGEQRGIAQQERERAKKAKQDESRRDEARR